MARLTLILIVGLLAVSTTAGDRATAAGPEAETDARTEAGVDESAADRKCVPLQSIDHTDVIDDYNILFYMRGPDIYHVRLPNRCPGLRIADSFMYSTSLTVLCNLDVIRPLRNFGGNFSPGAACGLGLFRPITKDEIEILKNPEIEADPERVMPEVEELE